MHTGKAGTKRVAYGDEGCVALILDPKSVHTQESEVVVFLNDSEALTLANDLENEYIDGQKVREG